MTEKPKEIMQPVEQRTSIWGADETSIRRFGVHPADDAVIRAAGQGIHEECIRRAFKGVETEEESSNAIMNCLNLICLVEWKNCMKIGTSERRNRYRLQ